MNELIELRKRIEERDYVNALIIVDELEEMSKEDKLNKIYSYLVILMLHLIKQSVEERNTSSWERSIFNSTDDINRVNKRRKSGGYYADLDVLKELIDEAYPRAVKEASYEIYGGKYSPAQIDVDEQEIKDKAIALLEY